MIQNFLPRGHFFSTNPLAPDITPLQLAGRGSSEGKGVVMVSECPKNAFVYGTSNRVPNRIGFRGTKPTQKPSCDPTQVTSLSLRCCHLWVPPPLS